MLQDLNVERYVENAIKPLKKEIAKLKLQIEELNKALRIHDVSVAKRKLCPTCGSDSLITLSDIAYCMNDCCDGVKGHN